MHVQASGANIGPSLIYLQIKERWLLDCRPGGWEDPVQASAPVQAMVGA